MPSMKLDIESVRTASETLPEKFNDRVFYSPSSGCYCWWGWLAKQWGHDPAPEYTASGTLDILDPKYEGKCTWTFLEERGVDTDLIYEADKVITRCKGDPQLVRRNMIRILEARNA